jgi:hypothetical protein
MFRVLTKYLPVKEFMNITKALVQGAARRGLPGNPNRRQQSPRTCPDRGDHLVRSKLPGRMGNNARPWCHHALAA